MLYEYKNDCYLQDQASARHVIYSSIARIHDYLTIDILNYSKIRTKVEIYRIFIVLV